MVSILVVWLWSHEFFRIDFHLSLKQCLDPSRGIGFLWDLKKVWVVFLHIAIFSPPQYLLIFRENVEIFCSFSFCHNNFWKMLFQCKVSERMDNVCTNLLS